MRSNAVFLGLALATGSPAIVLGQSSFPGLGLWDPQPMDASVQPPASVGAAIAATDARINARNTTDSNGDAGVGPAGDPVQPTCSLQVGSVTLPSSGSVNNQTVVASADVRGTIIQVCR